jgi:hypothetical protein
MMGRVPEREKLLWRGSMIRSRAKRSMKRWLCGFRGRSETGEDMAELQLHGGRAVIAAVPALGNLTVCVWQPGEFTAAHSKTADWI